MEDQNLEVIALLEVRSARFEVRSSRFEVRGSKFEDPCPKCEVRSSKFDFEARIRMKGEKEYE